MNKKYLIIGIIAAVLVIAFFVMSIMSNPSVDFSKESKKELSLQKTAADTQYLIIQTQLQEMWEAPDSEVFGKIDTEVSSFLERIGSVGNKERHLGFSILIPLWIVEKNLPGKLPIVIKEAFNVAKKHNVAVYFSIESHYFWDSRPDLWNYFDSNGPGYDPNNKNNVEWIDWEGTPFPVRYLDWGVPERLGAPHMCYTSPKIKSEITRLIKTLFGPLVKSEIDSLKNIDKEYLFAGITVTAEPSLDDYSTVDETFPGIAALMDEDNMPKVKLGYCALSNLGYSRENPPEDFKKALAEVNQGFAAFWAKNLVEAGISSSRLYTHVAAGAVGAHIDHNNAPLWVAFNEYSRPGWSTYPSGPIINNFDVLYEELAQNGNPNWGGVESNPLGTPPDEYMKWHFDHGATILLMNSGATGSLGGELEKIMWGPEAIKAYVEFLK